MPKRRPAVGADPLAGIDADRLASLLGEDEPRREEAEEPVLPSEPADSTSPAASMPPEPTTRVGGPRETPLDERAGLFRLAEQHAARGDHRAAADLLNEALEKAPDDVAIAILLGRAYGRLTAYDHAERVLQRALRIESRNAEARCELGVVLAKRGLYAAAIDELRRAVELDPALARGYYHLGVCLNQLDRLDEAVEAFESAVALHPRDDRVHYHLGIVYDRKGMIEDARSMYRRAREIGESHAYRG